MEPDDDVVLIDLDEVRRRIMGGADGQVDRRKVNDNLVLDMAREIEWRRSHVGTDDIREAEIRGATWALETMLHALPLTTPAEMQDRCIRIVDAKRGEGR